MQNTERKNFLEIITKDICPSQPPLTHPKNFLVTSDLATSNLPSQDRFFSWNIPGHSRSKSMYQITVGFQILQVYLDFTQRCHEQNLVAVGVTTLSLSVHKEDLSVMENTGWEERLLGKKCGQNYQITLIKHQPFAETILYTVRLPTG